MKKLLITLGFGLVLLLSQAQDMRYQIATPTNSLTCTFTNLNFTPTLFRVYWINQSSGTLVRITAAKLPIPYTSIFDKTVLPGIYSLQMTGLSNNVETVLSANINVYWLPAPYLPGAPIDLTTK